MILRSTKGWETEFRTHIILLLHSQREHPYTTSANYLDYLTPSPLVGFGTDIYYKIYATSLALSAFPWPPPHMMRTSYLDGPFCIHKHWLDPPRVCRRNYQLSSAFHKVCQRLCLGNTHQHRNPLYKALQPNVILELPDRKPSLYFQIRAWEKPITVYIGLKEHE